jgi:protein TonB
LNQTLANLARRSDEVRQAAANLRGGDEPARRVGGNIKPPAKLTDVSPVYPPIAASARVEGVVIIEATIDESGRVTQARVLRSIPLLDQAAIDAVRQWTFAPTLVDGRAVPVIMTVSVNFSLQ